MMVSDQPPGAACYFGSSARSKQKSDAIERMMAGAAKRCIAYV